MDNLETALDNIVRVYSHGLSLRKFKKEATNAWERKFPSPNKMIRGAFQEFVKDNLNEVRYNNPEMSHQDHMRLIGQMWGDKKPKLSGLKRAANHMDD